MKHEFNNCDIIVRIGSTKQCQIVAVEPRTKCYRCCWMNDVVYPAITFESVKWIDENYVKVD